MSQQIQAIVEFYPIARALSRKGARWEIADATQPAVRPLRNQLHAAHGLYIFYNSQGRAIYVGKAERLNLWTEMKSAFNRARTSQTIWKVLPAKSFQPNHRSNTRLRKHDVALHDIAAYFSAYAVEDEWIDTLEALLMRAFPNDLTNIKMAALVGAI